MAKPTLNTMDVEKIGRETDQNIRRLHGWIDAVDGRMQELQAIVAATPPPLTAADVKAIAASTTLSVGITAARRSAGPPPDPTPPTIPSPITLPDHLDIVEAAKAACVGAAISLVGDCGAFEITKRVAWNLVSDEAGLLDKPGGANCAGYAAAIICYPNGQIFDILVDAGGLNTPQWADGGLVDPTRWRPAIDPGPPYV